MLTSYINLLTSLKICVPRVNLAQISLTHRQIILRLNAQCNSFTNENLAQIISISLSSLLNQLTTHIHTHTHIYITQNSMIKSI